MDLIDFLKQMQAEVREGLDPENETPAMGCPYPELVFAEVVMQHMSDNGMTYDEPVVCHYSAKVANANLRLSGYSISDEGDQVDLFVSLYSGTDALVNIPDSETKTAAETCLRFLAKCAEGKLTAAMDRAHEAYGFAMTIQEGYSNLEQIRIYVLTDRIAKSKFFKARDIGSKTVKLEVMDIERLYRHLSEGKPRDEITVNFKELVGEALPCVCVPGGEGDYDCALTAIPGQVLFHLYEKYGARLLEANVRSFLSSSKKNQGIRDTIRDNPRRFMAYNNGIVLIVDDMRYEGAEGGSPGILWMKGMQIVNGGQTTASIYFAKKKNSEINLKEVKVPTKILVLKSVNSEEEEVLITNISRYANTQNAVQQADLSANKPYHVAIEKLSTSVYCPDGVGRWFYERATGSYTTMLAREGTTPARMKRLRDSMPTSRKITKTDMAKYVNAWNQKPHIVSLGSQKNFADLMKEVEADKSLAEIDASDYKRLIVKTIIYRVTHKLVRPLFQAFQGNVATYLVSMLSLKYGGRIDLPMIWQEQEISHELKQQLTIWAKEVHATLHKSAKGRMVSEWAKKPECWSSVQEAGLSEPKLKIPEIKKA